MCASGNFLISHSCSMCSMKPGEDRGREVTITVKFHTGAVNAGGNNLLRTGHCLLKAFAPDLDIPLGATADSAIKTQTLTHPN